MLPGNADCSEREKLPVTLKDIAKAVGVGESTVSRVLNRTPNPIKISEETSEKIFRAAKELGYQPNAAARALATRKTGHIGFILSDAVTDGFANSFFAQGLAGVEQACRERGYGLNISLYNLSNIDSFIFPPKVSQRSVDGLVLIGYVEAAVVHRFKEFGIPCICIGEDVEVAGIVPIVASDTFGGRWMSIQYAVKLGHKRILFDAGSHRRPKEIGQLLIEKAKQEPETASCSITLLDDANHLSNYSTAKYIIRQWLSTPKHQRPTMIMASDQSLFALLSEMDKHGLRCPEDISLLSNCESRLCEFARPALTSVWQDLFKMGQTAANILIDCLETGEELTVQHSKDDFPCKLFIRESCARIGDVQ